MRYNPVSVLSRFYRFTLYKSNETIYIDINKIDWFDRDHKDPTVFHIGVNGKEFTVCDNVYDIIVNSVTELNREEMK